MFTRSKRRLARRVGTVIAGIAVAAIVLTGCSNGGSGSGGTSKGTASATLNLGIIGNVDDSIDPYASQTDVGETAIWQNMYDLLTYLNGKGQLEMGLAQSFDHNANNTVWTMHLRPGVKLHDGGTFGADDVIFSIKRMFQLQKSFGAITQINSFVDPNQIKKINDLTVQFTLKEPYGVFPQAWSYPQLLMTGKDWTLKNPDGTGPFTEKSFVPNRQATLTKFDGYWGQRPGFTTLNIYFFQSQQSIVNALEGGQINLASAVPLANVSSLEKDGIQFLRSDSIKHLSLDMRTDIAPFNNPKVRQAMELIIDRQAVVQTAYDGYAKIGNDYDSDPGCAAPDVSQRKQDLAEAKKLLAEAGESHLSVDLVTNNGQTGMLETAQLLSQDAAEIGVTIDVKVVDTGTLLSNWLRWPFVVNFVSTDFISGVPDHFLPSGEDNAAHWNDAKIEDLAGQLFNTTDAQQQCGIIRQMQTIQYQDAPSIIAAYPVDMTPHSSNVHGLHHDMYGRSSYTFGGVTIG